MFFVSSRYFRINKQSSFVYRKVASGLSINLSLFKQVAARVDTNTGFESLAYEVAAAWRASVMPRISLKTSVAWLGKVQTKIMSASFTMASLLKTASTPNSYWNGLNR